MRSPEQAESVLRLFGMHNLMLETALAAVEDKFDLRLRSRPRDAKRTYDYSEFEQKLRDEATSMAEHYEVFYCLENTIRSLIVDKLRDAAGDSWWDTAVPQTVRGEAEKRFQREADSGMTIRSSKMIDYTTFGELGVIITSNWQVFADTLNNSSAVQKVVANLNMLRGPIAHCAPLAPDEILRLELSLRDWFRLLEPEEE